MTNITRNITVDVNEDDAHQQLITLRRAGCETILARLCPHETIIITLTPASTQTYHPDSVTEQ